MSSKITQGSRVSVSLIDGEEGFPYEANGVVTQDWEEINYDKKVDIKLDNGGVVLMCPKWGLKLIEEKPNH